MVKTTQAWGWLAAGVLAAGLNAAYHDGGLEWAHRIADRVQHGSAAVVALAGGRADQFVAEAALLSARNDTDRENETGSFSDATLANAQYGVAQPLRFALAGKGCAGLRLTPFPKVL